MFTYCIEDEKNIDNLIRQNESSLQRVLSTIQFSNSNYFNLIEDIY